MVVRGSRRWFEMLTGHCAVSLSLFRGSVGVWCWFVVVQEVRVLEKCGGGLFTSELIYN